MYELLVFRTKRDAAYYYRTGNEQAVLHRGKYATLNEAYLTAVAWLKEIKGHEYGETCVLRKIDEDEL